VNIERDEWEMDDKELLGDHHEAEQDRDREEDREGFHMRILKRVKRRGVKSRRREIQQNSKRRRVNNNRTG